MSTEDEARRLIAQTKAHEDEIAAATVDEAVADALDVLRAAGWDVWIEDENYVVRSLSQQRTVVRSPWEVSGE